MPLWMLGSDGIVGSCIEVTGNRGVFFCRGGGTFYKLHFGFLFAEELLNKNV
jgi:hypothetical protein